MKKNICPISGQTSNSFCQEVSDIFYFKNTQFIQHTVRWLFYEGGKFSRTTISGLWLFPDTLLPTHIHIIQAHTLQLSKTHTQTDCNVKSMIALWLLASMLQHSRTAR